MSLPIELWGHITKFLNQSDIKTIILISYLTKNEELKKHIIFIYTQNLNKQTPVLSILFNTLYTIKNINSFIDYINIKAIIYNNLIIESILNRVIIYKYVKHYTNKIKNSKDKTKFNNICFHINSLCIEDNLLQNCNTKNYF